MSHNHDDHSHSEPKAVSFTVPLILGAVTVFIILLFVSLGDGGHHGKCECTSNCSKECMESCEKGNGPLHGGEAAHHEGTKAETAHEESAVVADSTAAETTEQAVEPAKEEAHH
jgi:hypothetical protein